MTPEQLQNNLTLLIASGGTLVYETVAWRALPALASWTAYVPVMSRRIVPDPRARMALSAHDQPASYRALVPGSIDWARLPGPRRFDVLGARVDLDPANARALVRLPFQPQWFGLGGVTIVRLRDNGEAVTVTARVAPWLSMTSVGFFAALLTFAVRDEAWPIAAAFVVLLLVFNAVGAFRTRRFAAPIANAVAQEIESRIARAGAPSTGSA